jgi:hypothetical protein
MSTPDPPAVATELAQLLKIATRASDLLDVWEDLGVTPDTLAHQRLWALGQAVAAWKGEE